MFATKDARLHSRGISCFLVERSAPGVSVAEMKLQGLKGASLATLTLNDVGVDRANLIGRPMAGRKSSGRRCCKSAFCCRRSWSARCGGR